MILVAKFKQRSEAIQLRKTGESIKVIAKKLGVSAGSVSLWCKNVQLSSIQLKELERRYRDPNYGKRLENSTRQRRIKEEKIDRLLKEGAGEIGNLSKRELFLIGVALYWAEGFKKDTQVGFANSNLGMIKLYLRWLQECCNVKLEDLVFRVTLNISHKDRIDIVQKYWSKSIGMPLANFRKPFYQNFLWKKSYENPNEYFGVLRIKVRRSVDFLRKIHGWIEGLRLQAH
jgi:hypothetical protein